MQENIRPQSPDEILDPNERFMSKQLNYSLIQNNNDSFFHQMSDFFDSY